MKNIHIVFVVLFSCAGASAESGVSIPDPNLKAAIEDELRIINPTPTDMLGLTSLYAGGKGISDLTGLQYATNLGSLSLTHNRITDISVVSGLTELYSLVLNNNFISDISAVSGLTNLTKLDVHNNELTNISPVSGLTNLNTLYLRINRISDISPIRGLTNLTTLELRDNQISDLSPLTGLTELQRLNLGYNQIHSISALRGLFALRDLTLSGNHISDISALSGLTSLRFLTLQYNSLNDDAYDIYIPMIKANNPGITLLYDARVWYQVVISAATGGRVISPGEGEFLYGRDDTLALEAAADPGYVFSLWSGDYSSWTNPVVVTVDSDMRIQANFTSVLDTLYVDDDGPADPGPDDPTVSDPQENGTAEHPFDSIQEAIEVAARGTTIFVGEGTYRESIDFLGKSLEVRGRDPQSPEAVSWPVIQATPGKPVVTLGGSTHPTSVLVGFVLTAGQSRLAGGVRCADSEVTIAHCLIVGNRSTDLSSAAVFCTDSTVLLSNCTIADNRAEGWGGAGLYLCNSHATVANSILWGNTPRETTLDETSEVSVSYSAIAGGKSAGGNLNADPLFAGRGRWVSASDPQQPLGPMEPGAVWVAGDYHLQSQAGRWDPQAGQWVTDPVSSRCIDGGDPADAVGAEPLPNGGIINMGSYGGTAHASISPAPAGSP